MTAPAADEVTRAERTLTVTEALDQGWFVADFFRGEELIRRYGRTAEEAHARLLSEFEAGVTVQAPRGGVVTAPAEQPVEAARDEQALVQGILDAHDDAEGTLHGSAYRAMIADHWRLIETHEPERLGVSDAG